MYANTQALLIFLKTLLCGAFIGLCYDVLNKIIFSSFKHKSVPDAVFWITSLLIILNVLQKSSDIALRAFMPAGFLCGWFVYFKFISPIVIFLCDAFVSFCYKVLSTIYKPLHRRYDNFLIKNKEPIGNIKNKLNHAAKLPKKLVISYNTYAKYLFKGGKNGDTEKRVREKKKNTDSN